MYNWTHKSVKESKSRTKTQNPSFSSSLLDEIYCSMDVGDEKSGEFKLREEKYSRKHGGSGGGGARASRVAEDEDIVTLRRAFLIQKWMDMKVNAKKFTHRRRVSLPDSERKPAKDEFLLSSDLITRRSQKPSCFGPLRPKPSQADVLFKKHQQMENDNHTKRMDHGTLMNTSMKNVKQPISPGGRIAAFMNSLLINGRIKKPKDLNNQKIERTSKSSNESTCSSASSFTRSCLSKNSPRSREKLNNGIRRTVRFYPVSVIIDENCRPCGEKSIFHNQDLLKVHVTTMLKDKFDDDDDEDDDYDDDIASDASSDLFELDHLSILKECDELPVYGTTHFGLNSAIGNGLIC